MVDAVKRDGGLEKVSLNFVEDKFVLCSSWSVFGLSLEMATSGPTCVAFNSIVVRLPYGERPAGKATTVLDSMFEESFAFPKPVPTIEF